MNNPKYIKLILVIQLFMLIPCLIVHIENSVAHGLVTVSFIPALIEALLIAPGVLFAAIFWFTSFRRDSSVRLHKIANLILAFVNMVLVLGGM